VTVTYRAAPQRLPTVWSGQRSRLRADGAADELKWRDGSSEGWMDWLRAIVTLSRALQPIRLDHARRTVKTLKAPCETDLGHMSSVSLVRKEEEQGCLRDGLRQAHVLRFA
jgi:hypothetical protein